MTGRPLKLLISARDPGAAHNMIPVIRQSRVRDDIDPIVVASGAAKGIFSKNGIACEAADINGDLAVAGAQLIDRIAPDAILAGSSGPDAGIDEALILGGGDIPAFVLQDFWGDINPAVGPKADCYLVIDETAACLTRDRGARSVEIVGAPKYRIYEKFDIAAASDAARGRAGAGADTTLAVFFGQPHLPPVPCARAVKAFFNAAASASDNVRLLYRPHPREETVPSAVDVITDLSTEDWLCGCDIAGTFFSNCAFDLAHLNRRSPKPLVAMICLGGIPGIHDRYVEMTALETIPVCDAGLALPCGTLPDLPEAIKTAMSAETRTEIAAHARAVLPDPIAAPDRILDRIRKDVSLAATAS